MFIKSIAVTIALVSVLMAEVPGTGKMAYGNEYPVVELTDDDIQANDNRTLSKDTIYVLTEKVFVEPGATLTIQPGTIIKGMNGLGESSTALVITMGAYIIADGTKENPIIFTTVLDNLDQDDPTVSSDVRNGWGGLIVLGRAPTNNGDDGFSIEGLIPGDNRAVGGLKAVGSSEAGTDWEDSSGVLRYISIRHAGIEIAKDDEINSLSMAGVGSRTVVEYIEIFACGDDGIEIWGGAVNIKYLSVSFSDDDVLDFDCGWRGKMQFVFGLSDSLENSNANWHGEWDGDDKAGAEPFAQWTIANFTVIGGGPTANSGQGGFIFRANGAGHIYNSIHANCKLDRAIVIDDNQTAGVQDSRARFEAGDISFKGCILYGHGDATTLAGSVKYRQGSSYVPAPEFSDSLAVWGTIWADPKISNIGYGEIEEMLDPRPFASGPAYQNLAALPNDGFFTTVPFKGAFGETNWLRGWTALDEYGYLGELNNEQVPVQSKSIGKTVSRFSAQSANGTLTIAGTVVNPGTLNARLVDAKGRTVAAMQRNVTAGFQSIQMNTALLATGAYILETSIAGIVEKTQISITR